MLKLWLVIILLLLGTVSVEGAASIEEGPMLVPLAGEVAVHRQGLRGTLDNVVLWDERPYGAFSSVPLVEGVHEVAVVEDHVLGRYEGGYFLINAGVARPEEKLFAGREAWESALADEGIDGPVQLVDPATLAAGLSPRVLRPWDYVRMHGLFGITDDVWSLILQCLGAAGAFVMGLLSRHYHSPVVRPVVLALVVNVVAQILISGGGPGAFAGFIMFPIVFVVMAWIGHQVRGGVEAWRRRPRETIAE